MMQNEEGMTMSSTPSPSAVTPTNGAANGAASRRPPRKSTLTQQQKNQKRQRATQDQLMTLEVEFNKNPTPTAVVRERIAQEINMTERSVQIWFQNRRAKIKTLAKRSIETGEDCDNIPDSMRRYLALQAMEMGKGLGPNYLGRQNGPYAAFNNGTMLLPENSSGKVVIQHFTCRSLSIGTWRRIGQAAMDLVIFYSPDRSTVTYYINNDSAGYKIEYPFSFIKNITLESGDVLSNAEGAAQRPGGLVVELNRPPCFYMDSSGSGGFYQCGDFTEEQQASQVLTHHLGGHPKVLSGQLAKLVSLESFQNRHFQDPNQLPVSAPVSPVGNFRPASQPNQMGPPSINLFRDNNPMGVGMPPRGHKRQRSRSVPVAIDFSMLRNNPMPSFLIQPEHQQTPAPMQDPNIFAPIPQHHHGFGPMGPNLSIDTSASYNLDYRQQYGPMSATTANSPSEYGTPAFFASTAPSDNLSAFAHSQPSNGLPYLSPMIDPSNIAPPAVSPLSAVSPHGDPVIANQSPPLGSLEHGGHDGDLYSMHNEQTGSDDAALSINDMYAKQNMTQSMTLPFRGPLEENHVPHEHHLDMQNLVPYGTIDPQSLSPGLSPGYSNI
ncbi:MAG: hypothetical protein M1822_001852 [Bathelium mastoideum]|nr:MAG: hypothetical protein M1822_001852 [Bathelium mastoideum]